MSNRRSSESLLLRQTKPQFSYKRLAVFVALLYNKEKGGDCMINEDNLKIARHNFALASKDFGFEFESPFTLTNEIEAFGYIPNYGSKNGVVICLFDPPDLLTDNRVVDWCKEMDCFWSFLSIESLAGEYKRSYFRSMLRDWGKY